MEIIIYRLEDVQGHGPYALVPPQFKDQCSTYMEIVDPEIKACSVNRYPEEQPTAWSEGGEIEIVFEEDVHYFGFASLEQYRAWMFKPEWRKGLAELGVLLNKYLVEDAAVVVSPHQAIFKKARAKLVESCRPDDARIIECD